MKSRIETILDCFDCNLWHTLNYKPGDCRAELCFEILVR
jgi:hypothetical protein